MLGKWTNCRKENKEEQGQNKTTTKQSYIKQLWDKSEFWRDLVGNSGLLLEMYWSLKLTLVRLLPNQGKYKWRVRQAGEREEVRFHKAAE